MATGKKSDAVLQALRAFGIAYPGAHYKSPWPGHKDLAVNDKTFAYLSLEGEPLSISCKLPESCEIARMLPYTKPTGYGLGRSGWITATFSDQVKPDVGLLKEWIDESYRAQAPKRLVKTLPARAEAGGLTKKKLVANKKTVTKKKAAKKKKTTKKKKAAMKKKTTKKKTAVKKKKTAKKR